MQIGNQNVQFLNDDGTPMSPEDIQKALQGGKLDTIIPGTSAFAPPTAPAQATSTGRGPGGATPVAGETAKGPLPQSDVTAVVPYPAGPMREIGIGAGQFVRGAMSPLALPGDFLAAGNELSRPFTGTDYRPMLPTSSDLDALSRNLNITPPGLAPSGEGERLLAAGARGAGTALSLGGINALPEAAGPLARGFITGTRPAVSLPTTANMLRTMAPGVTGGVASQGTADLYGSLVDPNDPLHPGLGVVMTPVAGAVAGGFTPGFGAAAPVGSQAYRNFANRNNLNVGRGLPTMEDIGNDIQAGQGNLGMVRTSLSPTQWGKVLGPNVDPEDAAATVLGSPALTRKIVNDLPNIQGKLGAAAVANGFWPHMNAQTKESVIPDASERSGVEDQHGIQAVTGTAPPSPDESAVRKLVGSELGASMATYFSNLVSHDPKVQLAAHLIGYGMPFAAPLLRKYIPDYNVGRATVGAGVGLGNTGQMLPPSGGINYSAPAGFAPPQGQ